MANLSVFIDRMKGQAQGHQTGSGQGIVCLGNRGGGYDTALARGDQKVFRKGPPFGYTDDGTGLGRFGDADDHSSPVHVSTEGFPVIIGVGHFSLTREVQPDGCS